jgi:Xaa-Pro aminopeptidase
VIDRAEFAARRRNAAARIENVDALLVTAMPDVRYLTGFTGSNGAVLLTRSTATLITDPRYTVQAREESDCRVVIAKRPLIGTIARTIEARGWKSIGFDRNRLGFAAHSELTENSGAKLKPVQGVLEAERMVKSPAEIELIRQSVLTNSRAFEKVVKRIKSTATENEIAAEIEYQQRLAGAQGAAFESIVAAGPRSALPHARPTAQRIGADRLLLFDVGALQNGYCSDMTRMAHLGVPGSKAKKSSPRSMQCARV